MRELSQVQNPDQPAPNTDTDPLAGFAPLTAEDVRNRLDAGWRCVRYECCFSAVVATVRRRSGVFLTENWQERYLRGFGYSLLSLLCGPWGVPWGLVWTVFAVWINTTGGTDVTDLVRAECERSMADV